MQDRVLRGALALATIFSWAAALYVLQLHFRTDLTRQVIDIRWAAGTTGPSRHEAEGSLKLRDGQELEPGTWAYRLGDPSREAVRRIVNHPLVSDTHHLDRQTYEIQGDVPAVPPGLRTIMARRLGPAVSVALAVAGLLALWPIRREWIRWLVVCRTLPGVELVAAVACLCLGFWSFYDHGLSVDENIHYDAIVRLYRGDWSLNLELPMLPAFHALVAGLVWIGGGLSEFAVRLAVFGLSLATVVVFYVLAKTLSPEEAGTRTLQFTFLPILFPQFFLIYTDVTSLLFVLLMMLAVVRRRYWVGGGFGILACLVRQNNVIWLAFAVVLSHVSEYGWTWRPLAQLLTRYWLFLVAGVGVLALIAATGGQAVIGVPNVHPLGALYLTNICLLLFLAFFLFLPLSWGYRREIGARMRRLWPWLSVAVLFPVFWFGFVNDHPLNNVRPEFFLRNAVLVYFSSSEPLKLLFFVPIAMVVLWLPAVPLKKAWWLLYPFTVLFLAPEWLVEQRYYLVPLSLFLAAREPAGPWSERLQTAMFAAGATWLFVGMDRLWWWM